MAEPAGRPIPDATTKLVTLTVLDQFGKHIAKAHIRSSAMAGRPGPRTDGAGEVTVLQGQGSVDYWANATVTPGFDAGVGDKKTTVTFTGYIPVATSLEAKSTDGNAFDFDEMNADGKIQVKVKDQNGDRLRRDRCCWCASGPRVPLGDHAVQRRPRCVSWPVWPSPFTDPEVNGLYDVVFPAGQPEGSYALFAGLNGDGGGNNAVAMSNLFTYKAGEANVLFEGFEPQWADVNTTATVQGHLVLDDGTGLPNRRLNAAWTRGLAADGDDPVPDTTLLGGNPQVITTAGGGNAGNFTVQVRDIPDGPENSELGGVLDITGAVTPGIGPNADAAGDHGVDFVTSVIPAGATLQVDNERCPNDPLINDNLEYQCGFFADSFAPGDFQQIDAVLEDSLGNPLKGRKFTLSVDTGFFIDNRVTATPPPLLYSTLFENINDGARSRSGSRRARPSRSRPTATVRSRRSRRSSATLASTMTAGSRRRSPATPVPRATTPPCCGTR